MIITTKGINTNKTIEIIKSGKRYSGLDKLFKVNRPEIITKSKPFIAANSYPNVLVKGNVVRMKLTANIDKPNQ